MNELGALVVSLETQIFLFFIVGN